jgi:hypothetical protein
MAASADPLPLTQAVIDKCKADRSRLLAELLSYEPHGVMRLWKRQSTEHLREVTNERVDTLRRELALIDTTIEFAATVGDDL